MNIWISELSDISWHVVMKKFQKPKTSWNFKTKHENISYMISYNQMEMNILQTQIANY